MVMNKINFLALLSAVTTFSVCANAPMTETTQDAAQIQSADTSILPVGAVAECITVALDQQSEAVVPAVEEAVAVTEAVADAQAEAAAITEEVSDATAETSTPCDGKNAHNVSEVECSAEPSAE